MCSTRWQYTPQDLEEALRLLNEDHEIIGHNVIASGLTGYYYNIASLQISYQQDQAFLQGTTYTYKVQSNEGQVISITATQVNPCTFRGIAIGIILYKQV